ncbi:hypothetical protein BS78_01G152600 [Paspalum vaginatum]|nr:hypothetical protein BS78_01G152600 [Paspalum vaginatum]
MGEAEEHCSPGRSFSLMCLEDGADLDGGGFAESAVDDAQLLLLCGDAEVVEEGEKEEYMGHLVSKESSFACGSPSASSPAAFSSDDLSDATADASPSCEAEASSSEDDWFCCARRATVKWILETRACFGFSHRTAYLAVSYLDRFCLHRRFDRSAMPWAARLQAVACVSLAAKMEEERAPPLSAFRADDGYDFSSASIRNMELLVLSTLGWRMGDVTPLDYLPCLASRLRHRQDDNSGGGGGGGGALVAAKAAALIFSAVEAVSVLDYRPSTVAVAAVLAATHGAGATTKEALESEMSGLSPSSWLLDKEDVHACYRLMLSESSAAAAPSNKRAPPPRPSSGSMDVDAAAASNIKRARLELPATGQ